MSLSGRLTRGAALTIKLTEVRNSTIFAVLTPAKRRRVLHGAVAGPGGA